MIADQRRFRIGVILIAVGVFGVLAVLPFLRGYDARDGLLESLPFMEIRFSDDARTPGLVEVAEWRIPNHQVVKFRGALMEFPRYFSTWQIVAQLEEYEASNRETKTGMLSYDEKYNLVRRGVAIPLNFVWPGFLLIVLAGIVAMALSLVSQRPSSNVGSD